MKIILNSCWGGFSFSPLALRMAGYSTNRTYDTDLRTDPYMIAAVEVLGKDANGYCADLRIVEIPDTATDWEINDYDGMETLIYVVDGKLCHS